MLDKERLYRDITSVLGDEQQIKTGVYLPIPTAFVLATVFVILLAWVGAEIFQAIHVLQSI